MNVRLALLLLFLPFVSNAQETNLLQFGKTFKIDYKNSFEGIIEANDTSTYAIEVEFQSRTPKKIFLTALNQDYTPKKQYQLNDNEDTIDGQITPEKVIILEDKVLYFETLEISDQKNRFLKMRVLTLNGELIKAAIIDSIMSYKTNEDVFNIFESVDEKRFCVAKALPFQNNQNQKVTVKTFDKSGALFWSDQIELPYHKLNYNFSELKYDGNNCVYLLSKEPASKNMGFSNTQYLIDNAYNVWAYNHARKKVKEFEIKIKNKWINDLQVLLDQKKKLHIAGYYSNDRLFSVAGVFHLSIDSTFSLVSQKLNSIIDTKGIPEEALADNKELKDLYLRNVLTNNTGEVYIIGETYYKEVNEYYDPRSNITTYSDNFFFGSIWVTKYNQFGKIVYTRAIPKTQFSVNDDGIYLSYVARIINNDLHIFYNDHEKNAELSYENKEDFKDFQNMRRAIITCTKLEEDGTPKKVFTQEVPNKFIMIPENTESFNQKTIFFVAEKGREVQVIKFEP